MPHLRLELPEEWLRDEFRQSTGFDARKLLDHLVTVVAGINMDNPAVEAKIKAGEDPGDIPKQVPFINLSNLKHGIIPLVHAHVAGDHSKGFLHVTMSAGNETQGRTAEVRRRVALILGNAIDDFVGELPGLASVTVQVKDIDRDRGYTTTAERRKKREQAARA